MASSSRNQNINNKEVMMKVKPSDNLYSPKDRGEEDQGGEALPPARIRARRLHAQLCLGH